MARGCSSSSGSVWISWMSCALSAADASGESFTWTGGVAGLPVRNWMGLEGADSGLDFAAQPTSAVWFDLGPSLAKSGASRSSSPAIAKRFDLSLAVRVEKLLAALLPKSLEFGRCDVPIRTAFLADGSEVLAELFDGRASEEPVAIVDLVNDKDWLQHNNVRNHRIVNRISVFGDVEIFLNDAPRIGEKGPVGTHAAAIFVRLNDSVGRNRDHSTIAHLHLSIEFQQPFSLTTVFRTEPPAAKDKYHRILALQLGQLSMLAGVVAELIIRENSSLYDVWSHLNCSMGSRSAPTRSKINDDISFGV